ncbi:MAG: hypothetical protein M1826_006465 [Phylliscum demangeonii]|nr:MAG: hypothetical protein M1826_006465 [Phylliscum demangeonii]
MTSPIASEGLRSSEESSSSTPLLAISVNRDTQIEDDDDMDYEPTTEGGDADEEDDEGDEGDDDEDNDVNDESHDTEDELGRIQFLLSATNESQEDEMANEAEIESVPQDGSPRPPGLRPVSRQELLELFGNQPVLARYMFRYMAGARGGEDNQVDSDDVLIDLQPSHRRCLRRARKDLNRFPASEAGLELMHSGVFGSTDSFWRTKNAKNRHMAHGLLHRELGLGQHAKGRHANGLIAQDFRVRMYDTSNPYRWTYYKTVKYHGGNWTITDASLSPDNKFLAYSSIDSVVCLASTDPKDDAEPWRLDLAQMSNSRRPHGFVWGNSGWAIWSVRFSGDGREIVAGTRGKSVYVYDLETRQSILQIAAHNDDVNAVCYGDQSSPHILYSGSDDTTLKVWDRRSMGDGREAGVFVGHTEGITYVDSKGDGRYVLSNSKDQSMKLWDLRKMMTTDRFDKLDPAAFSTGFDYRWDSYDASDTPHPHDCSVVTFRGHTVLQTLIRCHFSPPTSTDSRYVYTGSRDGSVYIYNMDATLAGKVDVQAATERFHGRGPKGIFKVRDTDRRARYEDGNHAVVRDVSWHPSAPVIAATSWNSWGMGAGTCTVHSWNDGVDDDEGEAGMSRGVDEMLRGEDE